MTSPVSIYPQIGPSKMPSIDTINSLTSLTPFPGGQITAACLGDSHWAKNSNGLTVSSSTWVNGIANIAIAGHQLRQGEYIRYVGTGGSNSQTLDGIYQVRSIPTTGTFTFAGNFAITSGATTSADVVTVLDKFGNQGFMTWANALSGQRFNFIYNGGKGGDTTTNMLIRMTTEILALTSLPKYLFIMGGVNDTSTVTAATVSTVAATAVSNLQAIATLALQSGITPILMTVLPVGSGLGSAATRQACIDIINNSLRYYAGSNNGIGLIDSAVAIMNPATGFMLASCLSSDGSNIHVNPIGARCVGQMIADIFGRNTSAYLLTSSVLDNFTGNANNQNILDNVPWVATGGTVGAGCSGTAAQGFSCLRTAGTGTAVLSVPARTMVDDGDTIGFNQKMTITFAGATDVFDARIITGTDTATYSRMVAGGSYEMRMAIRLANVQGSGFRNINATYTLNLTDTLTGLAYTTIALAPWSLNETTSLDQAFPIGYCTTADMSMLWRSAPFTLTTAPTGSNGVGVRITINASAAITGGNPPVDIYIGRCSIVRVA